MKCKPVSPRISVADAQPSRAAFAALAKEGYAAVVNLREEDEVDERMSPTEEGAAVRACGMTYLHLPFSLRRPAAANAAADEFRRQMSAPPGRTLVHRGSGRSAAALSAIHLGLREGMRSEDVLAMARSWGLPIEPPELADFVAGYVERNDVLYDELEREIW
jgi:protein tyrosine phosphatase (PTP) superfamily phosphohydrolase (DUF442 family)